MKQQNMSKRKVKGEVERSHEILITWKKRFLFFKKKTKKNQCLYKYSYSYYAPPMRISTSIYAHNIKRTLELRSLMLRGYHSNTHLHMTLIMCNQDFVPPNEISWQPNSGRFVGLTNESTQWSTDLIELKVMENRAVGSMRSTQWSTDLIGLKVMKSRAVGSTRLMTESTVLRINRYEDLRIGRVGRIVESTSRVLEIIRKIIQIN